MHFDTWLHITSLTFFYYMHYLTVICFYSKIHRINLWYNNYILVYNVYFIYLVITVNLGSRKNGVGTTQPTVGDWWEDSQSQVLGFYSSHLLLLRRQNLFLQNQDWVVVSMIKISYIPPKSLLYSQYFMDRGLVLLFLYITDSRNTILYNALLVWSYF